MRLPGIWNKYLRLDIVFEDKRGVGKQKQNTTLLAFSHGSAEENVGIGQCLCLGPAACAATNQAAGRGWGGAYIHRTLTLAESD